jgi:hypothetical protein
MSNHQAFLVVLSSLVAMVSLVFCEAALCAISCWSEESVSENLSVQTHGALVALTCDDFWPNVRDFRLSQRFVVLRFEERYIAH